MASGVQHLTCCSRPARTGSAGTGTGAKPTRRRGVSWQAWHRRGDFKKHTRKAFHSMMLKPNYFNTVPRNSRISNCGHAQPGRGRGGLSTAPGGGPAGWRAGRRRLHWPGGASREFAVPAGGARLYAPAPTHPSQALFWRRDS